MLFGSNAWATLVHQLSVFSNFHSVWQSMATTIVSICNGEFLTSLHLLSCAIVNGPRD